jgi:hypothetical protein
MRTIVWTTVVSALLLAGCTRSGEAELLSHYEKNKRYHRHLLKTEKVQLYDGNLTKVALTATYLDGPSQEHNRSKEERFIVGLYIDDTLPEDTPYDFNLTLEGISPNRVERLAAWDKRLKEISFVSDWTNFFLVSFPHMQKNRFRLIFESGIYGRGELLFTKKAKYTFTKRAF